MQMARRVFAVLAWIFVALVAFQVFLAGVGVFGAGSLDFHREFGWTLAPIGPLVLLVAAAVARAGRLIGYTAALMVLGIVQIVLPWLKADAPLVAALHPVNALVIAWLGLTIARGATSLARGRGTEALAAAGSA
jgi:hypothetical protein